MNKPEANYREGIRFNTLGVGDTVYRKRMVNGFSYDDLIKITEILTASKVRGQSILSSNNGNKWKESREEEPVIVSKANSYLIDDEGFHHYFDALGRTSARQKDNTRTEHPSFGMLSISRYSGGHNTFFGSSIKHDGGIALRISPADVDRHLSRDWYHGSTQPYIEVVMSYTQFAEAITSLNTEGTPCTIQHLDGERIEPCPFSNKRMEFEDEFARSMKNMKARLDKLVEDSKEVLSASKAPNKAERNMILSEINSLTGTLTNHIPFIASQWNEQLTNTVKEAKGEIEGFMETKIRTTGIEALKSQAPLLED